MKKVIYAALFCVATVCSAVFYTRRLSDVSSHQKPIRIVVASYNNQEWYKKNLDSIFNQKYDNYHVVYIDDRSPDGTSALVEEYIKQRGVQDKITLIKNEVNVGAMANIYTAVTMPTDDENLIIVNLDGDDWFAHNNVLQTINSAYQDENVWMTYGNYRVYPQGMVGQCCNFPKWVVQQNAYRAHEPIGQNRCSHPRTFYAWLFKKVPKEHFMRNGEFLSITCDKAQMFAMLELAGGRHKFIPEVLYVYNCATPLNDYKTRLREQLMVSQEIHNYTPLEPLADIIA